MSRLGLRARLVAITVLAALLAVTVLVVGLQLLLARQSSQESLAALRGRADAAATTVRFRAGGAPRVLETPADSLDQNIWIFDTSGRRIDGGAPPRRLRADVDAARRVRGGRRAVRRGQLPVAVPDRPRSRRKAGRGRGRGARPEALRVVRAARPAAQPGPGCAGRRGSRRGRLGRLRLRAGPGAPDGPVGRRLARARPVRPVRPRRPARRADRAGGHPRPDARPDRPGHPDRATTHRRGRPRAPHPVDGDPLGGPARPAPSRPGRRTRGVAGRDRGRHRPDDRVDRDDAGAGPLDARRRGPVLGAARCWPRSARTRPPDPTSRSPPRRPPRTCCSPRRSGWSPRPSYPCSTTPSGTPSVRSACTSPTTADGCCCTSRTTGTAWTRRHRDRIFEPGHSTEPDGAGLGLALSRRLAHSVGGEVDQLDDGHGHFVITVPRG